MTSVLVAYGSKHGSTAEIAAAIAETLRESGLRADCLQAGSVDSLEGYDAVVVGSAVYMRRWRREAKSWLLFNVKTPAPLRICPEFSKKCRGSASC